MQGQGGLAELALVDRIVDVAAAPFASDQTGGDERLQVVADEIARQTVGIRQRGRTTAGSAVGEQQAQESEPGRMTKRREAEAKGFVVHCAAVVGERRRSNLQKG